GRCRPWWIVASDVCSGAAEPMGQPTLSTRLVFDIAQAMLAAGGLEATGAVLLDAAQRLTGADTSSLVQRDAGSGLLRFTHAAGSDSEAVLSLSPLGPGEGIAGLAVAQARVIWTSDILHDQAV